MFVIDLESYNDQELADSYAAGLYNVNRLRDKWYRDLTVQEKETERENVTVFDWSYRNPVMNRLIYVPENYDGAERSYIDKDGDDIVRWYRLFSFRTILVVLIAGLYWIL